MLGVDTNILARFLVKDDESQFLQVMQLLLKLEDNGDQAFISILVLLELNWVLAYRYQIDRLDIIDRFLALLEMVIFDVENAQSLYEILIQARDNTFDLSDLLIGCYYHNHGYKPIITFDRKASKIPNFILMKDFI